jgi:hypothetical protein
MLSGYNGYLLTLNILDILSYMIQGEAKQALIQTGNTIVANALPYAVQALGQQYAFITVGAAFTYAGYKAANNLYDLVSSYGTDEFELKSNLAYVNLFCHLGAKDTAKTYFENALYITRTDPEFYRNYENDLIGIASYCELDIL